MTSDFFGIHLQKPSVAVVLGGVETTYADTLRQQTAGRFDFVIAADSGADFAEQFGLDVDMIIGDFDSIDPLSLERFTQSGVSVLRFSPDKDATDFELALQQAVERQAASVVVIGGHGGRVDHSLANVAVLSASHLATVQIHALLDASLLSVVHAGRSFSFHGDHGDLVTLLAVHGEARGVFSEGLHYPLHGDVLASSSGRGVSNVMAASSAKVSIEAGTLLVIRTLEGK